VFNFDIFPEDSYDPGSGEFSSNFNFEPVPIDDVPLTGDRETIAQVYTFASEDEGQRITSLLRDLAGTGYFEPARDPKNPRDFPPLPGDLDLSNKRTVRGPFITPDAVEKFLDKTGLQDVGTPYYDEENDEFWIDIDTT
jgi:hypothetical protein